LCRGEPRVTSTGYGSRIVSLEIARADLDSGTDSVESVESVESEGRLGYSGSAGGHCNHGNGQDRARSRSVITEIGPVERDLRRDRDGNVESITARHR
jgi:hypothetical protein